VRNVVNCSTSAPAMKPSGLPDVTTTPLMRESSSTRWKTDSNSPINAGPSVLTDSPGWSIATMSTSSATVVVSARLAPVAGSARASVMPAR